MSVACHMRLDSDTVCLTEACKFDRDREEWPAVSEPVNTLRPERKSPGSLATAAAG